MTSNQPSALRTIEDRVQTRAKDLDLEMSEEASTQVIEAMINDEVEAWNDQFARGGRSHALSDPTTVSERALRNLTGYGPLTPLLADDDVWEIMVNSPADIFVKRHRGRDGYHDEIFHDDDHVERTLTRILDASKHAHRKLDPAEGLQDAQLDDDARVHIVHRDLARGGHLMVNIRKFTGVPFKSLRELTDLGTITAEVAGFLHSCVQARQTILFAGPPGSGKTTLLSCCAAELEPELRVVVAEEVFEADVALPNVASMQSRSARADRPAIDLRRLVAGFLRMAPDIAIVGEVRDREALPLLLTLSSGVKGFTTIHAGSPRQALTRLRFICQLNDVARDLPIAALNSLISESIDVVVQCRRGPDGPQVVTVTCVEDLIGSPDSTQFTTTDVFHRQMIGSPIEWTGMVPTRLSEAFRSAGIDLRNHLPDPHPGP